MESNSSESQALGEEAEFEQEEVPEDTVQALALKFLYEAVNGAWLQSVLTSPPLVAQSSAFQRLEYILIAWFLGNGTPFDSMFLNSLIGAPSTEKLKSNKINKYTQHHVASITSLKPKKKQNKTYTIRCGFQRME